MCGCCDCKKRCEWAKFRECCEWLYERRFLIRLKGVVNKILSLLQFCMDVKHGV